MLGINFRGKLFSHIRGIYLSEDGERLFCGIDFREFCISFVNFALRKHRIAKLSSIKVNEGVKGEILIKQLK